MTLPPIYRRQQLDAQDRRRAQVNRAFRNVTAACALTLAAAFILWHLPALIRYVADPFANCPATICPEAR